MYLPHPTDHTIKNTWETVLFRTKNQNKSLKNQRKSDRDSSVTQSTAWCVTNMHQPKVTVDVLLVPRDATGDQGPGSVPRWHGDLVLVLERAALWSTNSGLLYVDMNTNEWSF